MSNLLEFYSPVGPERVGFILQDGTVVEVQNVCPEPELGFQVRPEDLIRYYDQMIGTWHTHPGIVAVPSSDDHLAFRNYPMLQHHIIGSDGVRTYQLDRRGKIVETAENCLPRAAEGTVS